MLNITYYICVNLPSIPFPFKQLSFILSPSKPQPATVDAQLQAAAHEIDFILLDFLAAKNADVVAATLMEMLDALLTHKAIPNICMHGASSLDI